MVGEQVDLKEGLGCGVCEGEAATGKKIRISHLVSHGSDMEYWFEALPYVF